MRRLVFAACLVTACAPAVSVPATGEKFAPGGTIGSATPEASLSSLTPAPAVSATPVPASATPAPSPQQLSVFLPEQIVAGSRTPARQIEIPGDVHHLRAGPDESLLLLNPFDTWFDGIRIFDAASGRASTLPLPANAMHQYSFVGWLANGRLLITGREVWLAGARGEDLRSTLALFTHVASPSPTGRYIALWSPFADTIVVLEAATSATRTIAGPFRRCAQDGAISITWSPDETRIAATDCDFEDFTVARTRFIDVASGRPLSVLADAFVTAWLPSGDLIVQPVTRPSKQPVDPPPLRVVAPDGNLRRELPIPFGTLSPDGRYLAFETVRAAPTAADPLRRENVVGIVDLRSDRLYELGGGITFAAWSMRGELLILPVH